MSDDSESLESFVSRNELPHRGKVTEGYYEEGDSDGNREFSNGEILDLRRLICPLAVFIFVHPRTQTEVKISVSARNQKLRFRVLTQQEALRLPRSFVFRSIQEVIKKWPILIKARDSHTIVNQKNVTRYINAGDELNLIRVLHDDGPEVLELNNRRTNELLQIPATFVGDFAEVKVLRSYTLQELIGMATVARILEIDESCDLVTEPVAGLPLGFRGPLKMLRPQMFVELTRILMDVDEVAAGKECHSAPLLAPVNCDIRLAARDESYMPMPVESYILADCLARHGHMLPFVVRIINWTYETSILKNQVTHPGDCIVIYSQTPVDKVLACCGERNFLIPVTHKGRFYRIHASTRRPTEIQLASLKNQSFPFEVSYSCPDVYRNLTDDQLPSHQSLVFQNFVSADRCAVVSKLFGDVIGNGFHLPLRTRVRIRMERRWKKSMDCPSSISHLDDCSEEIPGSVYNEIMEALSDHEWTPAGTTGRKQKQFAGPPAIPPKPRRPMQCQEDSARRRPAPTLRPPLVAKSSPDQTDRDSSNDEDDDDDYEHDYSYIDGDIIESVMDSMKKEIHKAHVEIPENGNISHFTVEEMLFFLLENYAPRMTLVSWKEDRINGKGFAKMEDEELERRALSSPIIKFFRDRSRMQMVLHQL